MSYAMDALDQPASQIVAAVKSGRVSAAEICRSTLERIASRDGQVGAFLRTSQETAAAQAERVQRGVAMSASLGPLAGVPVAVKDVLCDSDGATTCSSRMLENYHPPYDSGVVERLKRAGAVLVGRTNMDEFAMGGSTENSAFQLTRNPWDHQRSPGGSSGGAAACVAAGMVRLSVGTDTGGSIRQPAAFCGVVGLKPTYGRVSRYGLVAFASSLDQVGPIGKSVEDVALLLEVIAGHDPRDSTSLDVPAPRYVEGLDEPLQGLRIGVAAEHFAAGLDPEVESAVLAAIQTYEKLGATIVPITLPNSRYAVATYYVIAPCEASSNLARYDGIHYGHRADEGAVSRRQAAARGAGAKGDSNLVGLYRQSRSEAFGPEVKRRIMLGTYALSAGYYDAYYLKALKVRRLIRNDFDAAFAQVDLIAGPCTPAPAFKIGEHVSDPLAMYLVDLYTVSANLAGVPAMSLPCGFTQSGLPIGLQLTAPPLQEDRLLRAGRMYEAATDWHTRSPGGL